MTRERRLVGRGTASNRPREFAFLHQRDGIAAQQTQLLSSCPLLFRAAYYPSLYPTNIGHWGIQCGPGWYPIIATAAQEIERELVRLIERLRVPKTLVLLEQFLVNHHPSVGQALPIVPLCSEIREVFGELRMSFIKGPLCDHEASSRIDDAVLTAERATNVACERCGMPGSMKGEPWGRVYCDDCSI